MQRRYQRVRLHCHEWSHFVRCKKKRAAAPGLVRTAALCRPLPVRRDDRGARASGITAVARAATQPAGSGGVGRRHAGVRGSRRAGPTHPCGAAPGAALVSRIIPAEVFLFGHNFARRVKNTTWALALADSLARVRE